MLVHNSQRLEEFVLTVDFDIEPAEGASRVSGDEAGRVEACTNIGTPTLGDSAHDRLDSGQMYGLVVSVVSEFDR
ncbi:hypothetical protein JOJ86_005196 [Rhodococcus percolatus]|uniref:hypothetical protein n=1 Tax=Rhodococcus opacus TaxID=37919 RepID=UPI0017EE21C1|nr:hypothetical protein [Rhodococcus opacus]MBA8964568.1 hypothetical protein [Rhodococcus opacus]MBP2207470.1 hypothetical protein [Rhodococcus opacus]